MGHQMGDQQECQRHDDCGLTNFDCAMHEDRYGFRWGPLVVQRAAEVNRQDNGPHRVLRLVSDGGPALDIYVSPTGRSVRVFQDGVELTAPATQVQR